MKKRILALLLLVAMSLPLMASCGESAESKTEKTSQSESKSESKSESQTESKSESKTEKETEKETSVDEYDGDADLVIYVDAVEGSYAGTGELDDPFDTVDRAYDAAVAAINAGDVADVVIWLLRGDHLLEEEILIDGSKITATDYHITFCGNADKDATLSTTSPIDSCEFERVDGEDYYYYQLPEGYRDEDGNFPEFRDLYFNGQPMTLAMTDRNTAFLNFDSCSRITTDGAAAGVKESNHLIYVHPHLLGALNLSAVDKDGYVLAKDAEGNILLDDDYKPIRTKIELWVKTVWQLQCLHIIRILPTVKNEYFWDAEYGEYLVPVEIDATQWTKLEGMQSLNDAPYWFANSIDFLDEPGEFYYDQSVGMLYIFPDYLADMDESVVSFSTAERVFHLEDAKNITFENLTIYGSTMNYVTENGFLGGQGGNYSGVGFLPYGMIYGEDVENITIDNCILNGCGGDSIHFRGIAKNITITNNKILQSGGAAIRCGKSGGAAYNNVQHNENIVVSNNYIDGAGCVYTLVAGILITSVYNLEVSYNTILNCSYSAMSIGWGWTRADSWSDSQTNVKNALICNNYIENYMTNMRDGGAIYTLNANASSVTSKNVRLNEIRDNYIVTNNNVGNFNTGFWGIIYHDGGSSHWNDHDNVFILPEEDVIPPCSYVYYQSNVEGQMNFCMDTTNLYIVGYPQDHKSTDTFPEDYTDSTNETPAGWYICVGRYSRHQSKYEFTQNPETGAWSFSCDYMKTHTLTATEIYLFDNFEDEDMTDDVYSTIESIYDDSGCTLDGAEKPTAAGEMAKTLSRNGEID